MVLPVMILPPQLTSNPLLHMSMFIRRLMEIVHDTVYVLTASIRHTLGLEAPAPERLIEFVRVTFPSLIIAKAPFQGGYGLTYSEAVLAMEAIARFEFPMGFASDEYDEFVLNPLDSYGVESEFQALNRIRSLSRTPLTFMGMPVTTDNRVPSGYVGLRKRNDDVLEVPLG